MKLSFSPRIWILMLGIGLFSGMASADTVTIGSDNLSGNSFPFTAPSYVGEYQQVYSSGLFSGPVDITAITFFAEPGYPSAPISGDFSISLSTTTAGINTISTNYASNIGSNNTLFFSGTVSHVASFTGGPFLYDPSGGNLLLDVDVLTSNSNLAFLAAGCSADTNRVYNLGGTGTPTVSISGCLASNPTSYGLETEFTFTPAIQNTPEPSSLLMLLVGVFSLLAVASRKKIFA